MSSNSPIFSLDQASGKRQQSSLEPQHHLPAYSQRRSSLERGFGTGPGKMSSSGSLFSKQVDANRGRAVWQPRGRSRALPGKRASTLSARDASSSCAGFDYISTRGCGLRAKGSRGEIKRLYEPLLNYQPFA